jgi:predicted nucleic acid-binding Zn ribbon protein
MTYTDDPNKFDEVLKTLYRDLGLDGHAKQYEAVSIWNTVVGSHIARVSEVEKIQAGTLYVKVKNAAWRNELTFKKQHIIGQLNEKIGYDLVKDIVFK